jgi:hypothetical protein
VFLAGLAWNGRRIMSESVASSIGRWQYGLHPHATGMRVRSLGRVHIQLGEALRLEMTSSDEDGDHSVHLQYYIVTDAGPWALWLSCAPEDVDDSDATLREFTTPLDEEQSEPRAW